MSRDSLIWTILLGVPLIVAPLCAQPGLRATRFDRLTLEDGLSHGMVWSLHQDAQGFLWFATSQGLNRYDGYRFKVYRPDPEDPSSISGSDVSEVFVDHLGELWIGTRGRGLNRFRRADESFEQLRHDPLDPLSLSHDVVHVVFEDRRGALWIGTRRGLDRLDRQQGTFVRYQHDPAASESLSGTRVDALCEDRMGALWVGTDRGLSRLNPATEAFQHFQHDAEDPASLGHDQVFAIREDVDGQLWIGTGHGLDRFDPRTRSFVHYRHDASQPQSLSHGRVSALHVDRTGELWIATLGGLDRLDRTTGTFVHYRHDPSDRHSLTGNSVSSIHEDESGILWFGTLSGVNKYVRRREQFATLRHRPGHRASLSSNNIAAILEDRSGELWVGTQDRGLDRIDRERRDVVHYGVDTTAPDSLRSGKVHALLEDTSGTLWAGTFGGLARFDRERERFVHYQHDPRDPDSLSSDLVLSLLEDRSGRLWIGTVAGLNRLDLSAGPRFVRYTEKADPAGPGREGFYALCEDHAGDLWFGSETGGLYRLDPGSDRWTRFRHDPADPDSMASDRIAALYEDGSNRLWIGTWDSGLDLLEPGGRRFRHYREKDGLTNDMVLGILEDEEGRLWLSTGHGLSRFDADAATFESFSIDDGLPSNGFAPGSTFRSPSGELMFGGPRGLTTFFPARITRDHHVPRMVLTEFFLFNEPVPLRRTDASSPLEQSILESDRIVLSHRQNVFAIEFAAISFAKPQQARYAYRLEGFDRDWIPTDATKRFAQYSNLGPGEYVFRVKGSNGDRVWSDADAEVTIVVRPAPWETWWAFAIYGLVLAGGIWGFVNSQRDKLERQRRIAERERTISQQLREADQVKDELIRELEAKNAELERFAYTVSHDLKSPLVTIKGFLGLAGRSATAGDQEQLAADLGRIGEAADHMRELLEEVLDYSRIGRVIHAPEVVALDALVSEATALVAGEIRKRGVEVVVAPDLPTVYADRARLLEVLQNLLENAVKFMGDQDAPRIEVGTRRDGRKIVFYVRDNGIGIESRYQKQIFGLFDRLDPGVTGTGVGLALAKRIVEYHGGRIWVESKGKGQGSTFCFTLPEREHGDADPGDRDHGQRPSG